MSRLIFLVLMVVFVVTSGCGNASRRVNVSNSFLDSIGEPFNPVLLDEPVANKTFIVVREEGESIDLVLPYGAGQWTWIYERGYMPLAGQNNSHMLQEQKPRLPEKMVYNLDTLEDGEYVFGAVGGGYNGYFILDLTTK